MAALPPGRAYNESELVAAPYSIATASAWALINLNAKKWATEHGLGASGRYSIARCVPR